MKFISLTLLLLLPIALSGQDSVKLYNPAANAGQELASAIQSAADQQKHVLIQVGGNWCSWCVRLHGFFNTNQQIDSILKADYVLLRINFSPENKNPEVLARLDYPQRFGFPVLLVLNSKGIRLHTQDSGLLEQGKGYDAEKIKRFLLSWNAAAVNPKNYQGQ
jgi:thiol:disulfide interchange protein